MWWSPNVTRKKLRRIHPVIQPLKDPLHEAVRVSTEAIQRGAMWRTVMHREWLMRYEAMQGWPGKLVLMRE
jgi:hypothetical protein